MEQLAPLGPRLSGRYVSGNPVAMAAGLATLKLVSVPGFFEDLEAKTRTLTEGMVAIARETGIPLTANQVGGMLGLFFTETGSVSRYAQAMACNLDHFKAFFHGLLREGIYLAPSAFEAGFMSAAHTEADIEETLAAARRVLTGL
jgi:glutamate-1-semialdehyde 2,1-aminomutase